MPVYSPRFLSAVKFVLEHETVFEHGHYMDWNHVVTEYDPKDKGGATRYGIDQRSHPDVDVASLTKEAAIDIYYHAYWLPSRAEQMPVGIGEVLFDIRVNGGYGARWLQEALKHTGHDIVVDGIIGPKTITAALVGGRAAIISLCDRRVQYWQAVVEANPAQARYLDGWKQRGEDLESYALTLWGKSENRALAEDWMMS
jgi:lysozyme family protein